MRHHVDVPVALPVFVGGILVGAHDDTGIAAEQVHLAEALGGCLHQALHIGLVGNVDTHPDAADGVGHLRRAGRIEVGDDHAACALRGEGFAQRAADARGTAGDDDHLVLDVHGCQSPGGTMASASISTR